MTDQTDATTGQQGGPNDDGDRAVSRRSILAGTGAALLALGAGTGTASAATGQVGTGDRPVERVFTTALDGGLTRDTPVTSLTGEALSVAGDGSLAATDARLTVTDGETAVEDVEAISFDGAFTVTETAAGVTVER